MIRRAAAVGLCLALGGVPALAESVEFSGYWKSFLSVTDVGAGYRKLGLWDDGHLADLVERVRLELQYAPVESLAFGAHYEVRLHWGDTVEFQRRLAESELAADLGYAPERPRFMDLEDDLVDDDSVRLAHGLDRLWARWEPDPRCQATIGRQAVSWGAGLIWSPVDLFAAFAPTEIDRDEKPGVDVVRLVLQPHENLSLDLVGEPLDLEKHWTAIADDSSLAGRLGTHLGEYDLHVCGGIVESDAVFGGDFSGYLGNAGFHGEVLRTWVDESDQRDYFRGLVGLDYGFAVAWNPYVALEYFYNGLGVDDPDDYAARRLDSSVRRVFARGIAYNVGRDYLGGTLRVQPNALLTLQATTLANLNDGRFREFATLDWSVTENFDLLLGVDVGIGPPGGEFTGWESEAAGIAIGVPDLYFLYGRFYF